jgi:putative phosphoesterase
MEENASIVLYGHTHVSMYKKIDGMIIANPGSITYPRGSEAGYGIIEIENGKATYANVPVEYFF